MRRRGQVNGAEVLILASSPVSFPPLARLGLLTCNKSHCVRGERPGEEFEAPQLIGFVFLRCAFGFGVYPLLSIDIIVAWQPMDLDPKERALFPKSSKLYPEGMEEILAILRSRVSKSRDGGSAVDVISDLENYFRLKVT